MYRAYTKTKWKNGNEYGEDSFNNFEDGIKNLEGYAKYKEVQLTNLGKAMKKLRTGQDVKIAVRGDSVMFGYNTITSGEEGRRRLTNTVMSDQNMSEAAKKDGYEGLYFWGNHPLKNLTEATGSIKKSAEQTANGAVKRTEVQIPDVFIQCLNEAYEGTVSYVDKVYTGDCAISSYYRYTEDNAADIQICNLGINDALAAFWGPEYVGNIPEFVEWYCKIIERALDAGTAFVILTPVLQTTTSSYDTDARTTVDVYEKILYDIGNLYGIPVLNGSEFNHNFNNKLLIDFTHFVCGGNESFGKRLAAPFVAGDLSWYHPVHHGDMVGVRPQEDSINVYGNACIDYTAQAPSYASMLDNNDLYDAGVNRVSKGLGVFVNYPLDGTVKDIYDKTLLEQKTLDELNALLTGWNKTNLQNKENAIEAVLQAQNDYIMNDVTDVNVVWREADLYARGYGVRGSDVYKTAYNTRMEFLQKKHGYLKNEDGSVTWAFYCEKDGMVAIPSLYSKDGATVKVQLDFADIVPEKAGAYLKVLSTENLATLYAELCPDGSASDDSTKISEIIVKQKYDQPASTQGSPSDICDWLNTDTPNYNYVEPSTCLITLEAGYKYNKRSAVSDKVIKITSKGWHTITLSSSDKGKFIAFGVQFLDVEGLKLKASLSATV